MSREKSLLHKVFVYIKRNKMVYIEVSVRLYLEFLKVERLLTYSIEDLQFIKARTGKGMF